MPSTAFRSNLYMGLRTTLPDDVALSFGVAYFTGDDTKQLRYACQDRDGLRQWGWTHNDGITAGLHDMQDPRLGLHIQAEFFKPAVDATNWWWRVNTSHLQPNNSAQLAPPLSMLMTFASPGLVLEGNNNGGIRGRVSSLKINSTTNILIDWGSDESEFPYPVCSIHTERIRRNHTPPEFDRTHFLTYKTSPNKAWKVMDMVRAQLDESRIKLQEKVSHDRSLEAAKTIPLLCDCAMHDDTTGSFSVVVLQRVLRVPSSITISVTTTTSTPPPPTFPTILHANALVAFDAKFMSSFQHHHHPDSTLQVVKRAVSNLLGSISYFWGSNLIRDPDDTSRILVTEPGALLTGVPSRAFFPRGFFWDEGFHQLVVARFNPQLSLAVLTSWFERFQHGWVAREQILGEEALERVPEQFRVQDLSFWNPPTIILALREVFKTNHHIPLLEFRSLAFKHLMQMHDWVIHTQQTANGHFIWRGRSADGRLTLTSGMDDYPRGRGHLSLEQEAHVDILSWLIWLEDYLIEECEVIKPTPEVAVVKELVWLRHTHNETLHHKFWNAKLGFFNDLGWIDHSYPTPSTHDDLSAARIGFVPHIGYVGLLPFSLQLISPTDTVKIRAIISALSKPTLLRAPGIGLRSLAANDLLFGKDEDYWRGAVWINMNYLTIRALRFYETRCSNDDVNLVRDLHSLRVDLTRDVISNIVKQYKDFGFVYESYHGITGLGRGTKPFTGWTSLVALLLDGDSD